MFLTTLNKKQQEVFQKLANRVLSADHQIDDLEKGQLISIDKEIGEFYSVDTSLAKANLYLLLDKYSHKTLTEEVFNEINNEFLLLHKDSEYTIKGDLANNLIEFYDADFKICDLFSNEELLLKNLSDEFSSKTQQKVVLFELLLAAHANNNYASEQREFILKVFNKLQLAPLIFKALERIAEQQVVLSQDIAVLLDLV